MTTTASIAFQSNDFELPIFQHHPKLAWLHDELMMAGCVTAHLCGSGSALYGVLADAGADETRIAGMLQQKVPAYVYRAHAASLSVARVRRFQRRQAGTRP